jgi:dTDP-glucose 4,6-dehydratase
MGKSHSLITFVEDRPGHDRRYAMSIDKISQELGWEPSMPFEKGLKDLIEWHISHESWWRRIKSGEYAQYYKRMYSQR